MSSSINIITVSGANWHGDSRGTAPKKPTKAAKSRSAARDASNEIYPFFREMAAYQDNPFWVDTYIAMSRGDFGSINKNVTLKLAPEDSGFVAFLTYKFRGKEQTWNIDEDPAEASAVIKDHLMSVGIMSPEDRYEREMESSLQSNPYQAVTSWSKIRSDPTRKAMIHEYANAYARGNGLTREQLSSLIRIIISGYAANSLTASNFQVENGRLTNVTGVYYANGRFLINPSFGQLNADTPSEMTPQF